MKLNNNLNYEYKILIITSMDIDFALIYFLVCFVVGIEKIIVCILEIIFVSIYYTYNDVCYDVWNWIAAAAVFDMLSAILCAGYIVTSSRDSPNLLKWKIAQVLHLPQIIIAIWSASTYFNVYVNATDGCYSFWKTHAPVLWSCVLVHFSELWIGVIILLMMCCCGILYCGCECLRRFFGELFKAG